MGVLVFFIAFAVSIFLVFKLFAKPRVPVRVRVQNQNQDLRSAEDRQAQNAIQKLVRKRS